MDAARTLLNVVLAAALVAFVALTIGTGFGVAMANAWERDDLDDGATDRTWAWLDGRPIHYVQEGPEEGPLVVLVHGCYVDGLETWRESMRGLVGAGVRVLAVDLAGFGRSTRDPEADYSLSGQASLLARFLNERRLAEATVVGHGWGAAVALELARTQPQLVGRLGLVSPIVYSDPAPLWAPVARLPYVGRAAAWIWDGGGPLCAARRGAALYTTPEETPEGWEAGAELSHIRGTSEALRAMAQQMDCRGLAGELGHIVQPTLIIVGSHDRQVPQDDYVRLEADLPNADLAPVGQAGHLVHVERADQVVRLIADLAHGRSVVAGEGH